MVSDRIEYIIMLVQLFAKRFELPFLEAYRYVSTHGGIEYAECHYDILHTLPFDDQVEGLVCHCRQRGGLLA